MTDCNSGLDARWRAVFPEKRNGMLGVIFRKAQNKIQDPAKLRRLIADLIDKEQWSSLSADVKGDAYEGLLQKNAEDVKGGAGQYFTPRALIAAIVDVIAPQPGEVICDPACGTGGFLLAAHDYLAKNPNLDRTQKKKLIRTLAGALDESALVPATFLGVPVEISKVRSSWDRTRARTRKRTETSHEDQADDGVRERSGASVALLY